MLSRPTRTRPAGAVRPRPGPPGASPPTRGGGSGLYIVPAGLLLAAGALAFALTRGEPQPDPHYVKARDAVAAYELGKDVTERDYDLVLYQEALQELALVDPGSISAEPAALLAREIRTGTEAFRARQQARQAEMDKRERQRWERDQAFLKAQTRAIQNPRKSFPECEEEEERGHKHAHDHDRRP